MALYRQINYREQYPEASEKVIAELKRSDRKMEYFEYDLKAERSRKSKSGDDMTYIPSREDSLDRLLEGDVQFCAEQEDVEETAVKRIMLDKLRLCVAELTAQEMELIHAVFYEEKTQTELQEYYQISQQAISKRLKKVLGKLAHLMKI